MAVAVAAAAFALMSLQPARNFLRLPATRDWSTPALQDGMELASIGRDTGWIEVNGSAGPEVVDCFTQFHGNTLLGVCCRWTPRIDKAYRHRYGDDWRGMFQAYGRSSTGSKFGLPVEPSVGFGHLAADGCISGKRKPVTDAPPVIGVNLPGAYPASYRWIDVTLVSGDGHRATWRITNLPHTHRVPDLAGPENFAATTPDRVQVKLVPQQWKPRTGWYSYGLSARLIGGRTGQTWFLAAHRGQSQAQWETDDAVEARRKYNCLTDNDASPFRLSANKTVDGFGDYDNCPYPEDRYVRVFATLTKFATIDENVAFTGVPVKALADSGGRPDFDKGLSILNPLRPMTAKTPSGVQVRLLCPRINVANQANAGLFIDPDAGFGDTYAAAPFVWLPASPLCKTYRRPVQLTVLFQGRDSSGATKDQDHTATYAFRNVDCPGPLLHKAVFTIRQRAIVGQTPMSFVIDRQQWANTRIARMAADNDAARRPRPQ